MKYAYPIAITHEPDGNPKSNEYLVYIPDFVDGAATDGKNVVDGLEMAEDWLSLMIDEFEKEKKPLPQVSTVQAVQEKFPAATVSLVVVDLEKFRKQHSKSVKKTLSIPAWLNEKALSANINFSQTLQEALMERLGL